MSLKKIFVFSFVSLIFLVSCNSVENPYVALSNIKYSGVKDYYEIGDSIAWSLSYLGAEVLEVNTIPDLPSFLTLDSISGDISGIAEKEINNVKFSISNLNFFTNRILPFRKK